jgi:NADH pyrophosphatase NudC (nudix superfamily)
MGETVEQGMIREIKEETGLDVTDVQYLFSSPNVYVYSGMGVHTLDMDYLVRVHGDHIPVKAEDDAAEAMWIPINEVNPAEFGLTSIRNAVIRFLGEKLRK